MRPDELVVRAATADDTPFVSALRSLPGTSGFLAVSAQTEHDLRAELATTAEGSGRLIAETGSRAAALRWTVVFERAGFQREGTRRRAYWRRAAWQDGVHYGLLADEL